MSIFQRFIQPLLILRLTCAPAVAQLSTPASPTPSPIPFQNQTPAEQRKTLETQLDYARTKLASARNHLDLLTKAGKLDEADRWHQEVKDWERRVTGAEFQLAHLDDKLPPAIRQPSAQVNILIPFDSDNAIFVTGSIARGGSQPFVTGATLGAYAAILNAGGFSRFADIKKVYVLRASPNGSKLKIPVNIDAIQHLRAPDLLLKKNDIVVVPEKFFSF